MNVKWSVVVSVCLAWGLVSSASAASKLPAKKPNPESEAAPIVLFDAVDRGLVETSVIAKGPHEANVFVRNKTDAAVTVQFPKAVVAVPVVLKQRFGQRGAGLGGPGGNPGMGAGGGAGTSQSIGGGMQQMGQGPAGNQIGAGFQNGVNGMNPNGVGVFSVPSQATVKVPLATVCLSHGKPDPRPRIKYQLVKLEDYSNDPVLHETLKLFASGAFDTETAQAAAWHLTDKMSWEELRMKPMERLSLDPVPYFAEGKVDEALQLIRQAQANARSARRTAETASLRRE